MPNLAARLATGGTVRGVLAIAAVVAAFFLREAIVAWLGPLFPPYVVFYPTVMLGALLAGLWPGIAATAVAVLLSARWILPPRGQWEVAAASDAVGLGLFAAMGVFLSGVAELYRRSRRRVSAIEKALVRQESDQLLRQHHEWFRVMLTSIGDAVVAADMAGRVTFLNPVAETLTGWSQEEALGQPVEHVFRVVDEATHTPAENMAVRVLHERCAITLEEHRALVDRHGSEIPIESVAAPIQDRLATVSGVVVVFHDVTHRRRAATVAARERANLQAIFNAVNVGLLLLDEWGAVRRVNETLARWVGKDPGACCGAQPGDVIGCVHAVTDIVGCGNTDACDACPIRRAFRDTLRSRAAVQGVEAEVVLSLDGRQTRLWLDVSADPLTIEGRPHVLLALNNITDRKQAEAEIARLNQDLQRRLDELQTIFNTAPIGLAIAESADGCSIRGNPSAEQMLGVPAGGDLSKRAPRSAAYRCLEGDRELTLEELPMQRAVRGEIVIGQVLDVLREDARRLTLYCSAAPLYDEERRPRGAVGAFLDITPLREADKKLLEAKAAAEAANVAKSQFLASMSHELRTPMNAILGMTDLALDEPLPANARDYLITARESAGLLLELLNEILDFSRIEAGRFELESAPFSLGRTIEQVVKSMGVQAHEKGLELVCDLADDLPEALVGDSLRLRQVLINLLSNAIKFTSKGEVMVTAIVTERTPQAVTVQLSVADTGIGIAPENQERVFAPFTQADASTTRRFGGTGLGLAISQRLVNMMGGRIWLQSQPGEGSTFFFEVTLHLAEPATTDRLASVAPDLSDFADVPVLIVAENATSRRILLQTLASWSMRPDAVADVPAALARIHEAAGAGHAYRLVLADAAMPGIDGFTLAGWLQQDDRLAGSTILMVSTGDRQGCPDRCDQVGAICLEKPVSRSTLFDTVARALGVARPTAPAEAQPQLPAVAVRTLRILLAEDTPANQKLVCHVLGRRGHSIVVASNGQEALDWLCKEPFDLVLMDVQMPVMDGFQATSEIRKLADPCKARLPVVAMTAHALKGDAERCLAAGMDAYLSKPIKAAELVEVVERLGTGAMISRSQESNA